MNEMINGIGAIGNDMCRLTLNGKIAVKCSNGYKSWDSKTKRLTNVSNFCFGVPNVFFSMPTMKVKEGDIIIDGGRPKCVISSNDVSIKVIDYEANEIREIVPERHFFMGMAYFYGKIWCPFGKMVSGNNAYANVLKWQVMSETMKYMTGQASKNGTPFSSTFSDMPGMNGAGGFLQMMMMPMFMKQMMGGTDGGGDFDLFGGMFNDFELEGINPTEEEEE